MDDARQFNEHSSFGGSTRNVTGLSETEASSRLTRVEHPARWHGDLARIVEAEIIPRLMLAHRAQAELPAQPSVLPSAEQIEAFAALVLAPACDDLEAQSDRLVRDGLPLDSLLLDLLAPTARYLGALWEEDLCDFAELTIAMGRLQRIMNDLTVRFAGETERHRHGRSILLVPCPGETHSFGLSLIDRFFRDAGWDVTSAVREAGLDPLRRARDEWFDVVGLSLGCETLLPTLAETVVGLRQVSRNRDVRVMVGGPIFIDNPDYLTLVGADATAGDARRAIAIAESLLDLQTRPC